MSCLLLGVTEKPRKVARGKERDCITLRSLCLRGVTYEATGFHQVLWAGLSMGGRGGGK